MMIQNWEKFLNIFTSKICILLTEK